MRNTYLGDMRNDLKMNVRDLAFAASSGKILAGVLKESINYPADSMLLCLRANRD